MVGHNRVGHVDGGVTVVFILFLFLSGIQSVSAVEPVCIVYFSGIGCPHCAKTDPVLLDELLLEYNESLVVIEYEVYHERGNVQVMDEYMSKHGLSLGIPQVVFFLRYSLVSDKAILEGIKEEINLRLDGGSPCVMMDSNINFSELDLDTLPGKPRIWVGDKVLVKKSENTNVSDDLTKGIMLSDKNIDSIGDAGRIVEPEDIPISGGSIIFNKAVEVGGWTLQQSEGSVSRVYYPLEHYLDYTIYAAVILGLAVFAVIHFKEKKLKKESG